MSGHSHYSTIKHKKAASDAKRSKIFSKISSQISIAVKEKGTNPETNSQLKFAIEQARKVNMPSDNIERAIKKGSGEAEGEKIEGFLVEAFGPGNTAIIIEGITDNKNRTMGEIKQILTQHNGKIAGTGSVKWLFERKGCLSLSTEDQEETYKNKEALELAAIEGGAEDIRWEEKNMDILTKPEELEKVKDSLEKKGVKIDSQSLDWIAKDRIILKEEEKTACFNLFEALDENESVQEIYSNIKS